MKTAARISATQLRAALESARADAARGVPGAGKRASALAAMLGETSQEPGLVLVRPDYAARSAAAVAVLRAPRVNPRPRGAEGRDGGPLPVRPSRASQVPVRASAPIAPVGPSVVSAFATSILWASVVLASTFGVGALLLGAFVVWMVVL